MFIPAYKLTFSQKTGGAPSVLGAAASAGGRVIDTTSEPKASTVVDLKVTLAMDTPADSVTLVMGQIGKFRPAREDEVKIELGYADDSGSLTQVMSGTVVTVEPNLTTARVIGHSAMAKLLRTFVDKTYEGNSAGEIVKDLAGKAGVDVETANDGINFPAYVVDGRRNAQQHMRELANLCGFDLYINAAGKLVFEKFANGKTVHVLEYAKHIVANEGLQIPPRAGKVEAWGESPGSSKGKESWAWLTKDFSSSKGTAGSDTPLLFLERSALRTPSAASTAAQAAFTAIQRQKVRGQLVTIGRPEVKLGDAIKLQGMPDETWNNSFQVRSVTHRITKQNGFTTAIGFRAIQV